MSYNDKYGEPIRHIEFDGYRLKLWETPKQATTGQWLLAYELQHPDGRVLFTDEDYGCSPMCAVDSDECVRGLLGFLTLRPGDADDEYFDGYTAEQLEWAEAEAELLSLWSVDTGNDCEPMQFTNLDDWES